MDILYGVVEDQSSAVRQLSSKSQPIQPGQFKKRFLSQLPQISGDDQIIIRRRSAGILKVGFYGRQGGRSHGTAHIVGILNP